MQPPEYRLTLQLVGVLLAVGSLVFSPVAHALAAVTIERSDPRLFAYQLGDVIAEHPVIRLAPGYALDPQSLPRPGKRSGWFMIRDAKIESSTSYADASTAVQLLIELQLVNSPKIARTLTVPPIALHFKGPEAREDTIPSLTIDAVPLGTGEVRTGLPDIRAPRAPAQIPLGVERRTLRWSALLAVGFAVWLALALLVRRWRPQVHRPHTEAARELRALLKHSQTLDGARAAVRRVHRAFDQSAGHRLFGEGVPAYCARMGVDAALQERTTAFFTTSQALFFSTETGAIPLSLAQELRTLNAAWQRFEKRHPRHFETGGVQGAQRRQPG